MLSLYYFSGTGNTKLIAQELKNYFQKSFFRDIELKEISGFLHENSGHKFGKQGQLLGIGFPVYDLHHPEIISRFINQLPPVEIPVPVFIFCTMALLKGDCLEITSRALKEKGYYVIHRIKYLCPSNGVTFYEKPGHPRYKNVRFEKQISRKISENGEQILKQYEKFHKKPFHLAGFVQPWINVIRFFSERLYGDKYYRDLQISNECKGCRVCVTKCPDQNLIFRDNKIVPLKTNGCLRCLKCVSSCTVNAINFTSSARYGHYNKSFMMKLFNNSNT